MDIREDFVSREGVTNGNVRQRVYDGVGNSEYDRVFAGNARKDTSFQYEVYLSNQREVKEGWSLGTNTLDIEKKLRARKRELGWREP